ncbi:MAG: hypothetical protein JXA57_14810 [Armatimonadetes bacterium]|nr:hypothetical protein [Armatimonadota bacterium]
MLELEHWEELSEHWFTDRLHAQRAAVDHRLDCQELGIAGMADMFDDVIPRSGIGLTPFEVCGNYYEPDPPTLVQLRELSPLPKGAEDEIAAWCSEYGLLGIIPHIAESVTLIPIWRTDIPGVDSVGETKEHYRANGKWLTRVINCTFEPGVDLGRAVDGKLLPLSEKYSYNDGVLQSRGAYSPRCPGSRTRHIEKYGVEMPGLSEETLYETWCDYFPDIPSSAKPSYRYPRPLTEEFWHIYAEPVEAFLRHALVFQNAVTSRLSSLETLLEPVGVELVVDQKKGVRQSWSCPSLLSMFAAMAAQDLAGGFRILRCRSCGEPFTTSAYQAVYCSKNCAWRDRKRRARRERGTTRTKP